METVKKFKRNNIDINIVNNADDMGIYTAKAISEQLKLVYEKDITPVLWLMAAPSAFPFYKSFIELLKSDHLLRKAVSETEFFQFDDYPVSRGSKKFATSFRSLLETMFFSPITDATGIKLNTNPLELVEDEAQNKTICKAYFDKLFSLKDNGAYIIQLKGIGMDGHWGFHGADTPLDSAPKILRVPMKSQNIKQQMLDWPEFFKKPEDVPECAYTFNVQAFLKADMIVDNVPQQSKEFAVLATYANDKIINDIPSSAIKEHKNGQVFLTLDASRALVEYINQNSISSETIKRLNELWSDENKELEKINIEAMNNVLNKIGI